MRAADATAAAAFATRFSRFLFDISLLPMLPSPIHERIT